MKNKILRIKGVQDKTGLPQSTVYLLISKDDFPKPIKLGIRSVGWLESEIDEWIQRRIENHKG